MSDLIPDPPGLHLGEKEDTFSRIRHHRLRHDPDATGRGLRSGSEGGWQPLFCLQDAGWPGTRPSPLEGARPPGDLPALPQPGDFPELPRAVPALARTPGGRPGDRGGKQKGWTPVPRVLSLSRRSWYLSWPPSDLRGCRLGHPTPSLSLRSGAGAIFRTGQQFELAQDRRKVAQMPLSRQAASPLPALGSTLRGPQLLTG